VKYNLLIISPGVEFGPHEGVYPICGTTPSGCNGVTYEKIAVL